MSSVRGKCSICQKPLDNPNKREVTTSCGHTFHRECAQQRMVKGKSNDCPTCRKTSAIAEALTGETTSTNKQRDSTPHKSSKNVCSVFMGLI